jgi:hypothetical protein
VRIYSVAVRSKAMLFLPILVGLLIWPIGIWYCVQIKQTPKDKMVPWGFLGGAWMTHDAAYAVAISLFILATACFLIGLAI